MRKFLSRTALVLAFAATLLLGLPLGPIAGKTSPQVAVQAPPYQAPPSKAMPYSVGPTTRVGSVAPVAVPAAATPPDTANQKWALLIGIGKFTGKTKPNPGSAGDAADMKNFLMREGWMQDHIRVLTDADATAGAIREGLGWLVDNCKGTSACMFHYSGHVKQLRSSDGDAEAVDEALWSYENKFIPDGEVARYLKQLPTAWINISGCEAAGFNDGLSSPQRLFTASSKETEKSYEHPDWKNSVWTGLLVDQGIMQGQADSNSDDRVTRTEALEFASSGATIVTKRQAKGAQHPQWAGGEAFEGLVPEPIATPVARFGGPCVFGLPCFTWSGPRPAAVLPTA